MYRYLAAFFILIFTSKFSFADPESEDLRKRRISGQVIDKENGYPLEYATISFWSVTEKVLVDGCVTDSSGKFEIKLKDDTYEIVVEYI